MECLNLKEVLLAFSEQFNALFVTLDNHVSENLMSLTLLFDLSVFYFNNTITSFLLFFFFKRIGFNSKLGVKLSAGL